jgi:hypothetical protein
MLLVSTRQCLSFPPLALIRLHQRVSFVPRKRRRNHIGLGIAREGEPFFRVSFRGESFVALVNRGPGIWFEGRTNIERQEIILPNDRELIGQMTSRLGWPDSKGRLQLESKQDMRSRGLSSPDRADAVLGTLCRFSTGAYASTAGMSAGRLSLYNDSELESLILVPGRDF